MAEQPSCYISVKPCPQGGHLRVHCGPFLQDVQLSSIHGICKTIGGFWLLLDIARFNQLGQMDEILGCDHYYA